MGHYLTDDPPVVILHTGGFLFIDFALGTRFTVYLTGNVTGISYLNADVRDMAQVLFLQDATGGRTVTFPAAGVAWRYSNGVPTIDTDPSAVGSLAGRTVVMMSRLDAFPAHMSVWPVPKPDWHVYSVELAVLLANAGAPISDASKANLISPALVGTPTAPTAAPGTNTTQIATTAFANAAVAAAVDAAPAALDTLNELAAAINDDASFAATVTTALGGKQAASGILDALVSNGTPTAYGLALLLLADAAAGRSALGLGTAALAAIGTSGDTVPKNNTANTFSQPQAITGTAPSTPLLVLQITEDSATGGPIFELERISASPAAADIIGQLRARGRDSANNVTTFASIFYVIENPADGAEAGSTRFSTIQAGAAATRFIIGAGLYYGTGADMGANTINATAYYASGVKVVGARVTGWTASTGTAERGAYATYTAPTISASPTQAEVQAIANALQNVSRQQKAMKDDLIAHGLIGA